MYMLVFVLNVDVVLLNVQVMMGYCDELVISQIMVDYNFVVLLIIYYFVDCCYSDNLFIDCYCYHYHCYHL